MNHQKKWLRARTGEDPRVKKIADVIRYASVVDFSNGNVSNADEVARKILEKLR